MCSKMVGEVGKNSRHSAAFQYEGVQLNGQHCKGFFMEAYDNGIIRR